LSWLSPDPVFPFEQIAVRNREIVRRLGYAVELRVDEGGIHWPSRQFQGAAVDWFFAGATATAAKHSFLRVASGSNRFAPGRKPS
jgi:hypothetical protein